MCSRGLTEASSGVESGFFCIGIRYKRVISIQKSERSGEAKDAGRRLEDAMTNVAFVSQRRHCWNAGIHEL